MDDDRILGELKEFKRATLDRLDEIENEIKALSSFKWKSVGALAVLILLLQALTSFAF